MIVFPDVELLVVDALNEAFEIAMPGVEWFTKVPNPRPTEFGRVIRTGGPVETLVSENAQITLEGWAYSEARAFAILSLGRAIAHEFEGALFGVTEFGGPINLPDPTTAQERYTLTLGVRARGLVQ